MADRNKRTKRKSGDSESHSPKRGVRSCQKTTCPNKKPSCFALATEGCAKDGHTSRWYHMSDAEHFCNECFDNYYRTHKRGFKEYEPWKSHWSSNCRKEANLKVFMAEEILPYWVQCNDCDKWRQLKGSKKVLPRTFCEFTCKQVDGISCSSLECEYVKAAKSSNWIRSLPCLPYLKDSPASPFLRDFYYDSVGLSPSKPLAEDTLPKFPDNLCPFYSPEDTEKARCICADVMTAEEREEFPDHVKDPSAYLGLRNLVVAMWNLNPKQYLNHKTCMNSVICRGLGRITLSEELKRVLDFLTINGHVNFGVIPRGPSLFNLTYWKGSVLVLGGGIAGLSAARQLQDAGCKVILLEATERPGGRMKDDKSLGNCVGLGAQIITGCTNNPLFVMCKQLNLSLRYLGTRCDLLDDEGNKIDSMLDQEVEFHFNLMLDSLEDWKQSINKDEHERFSLSEALAERLKELQKSISKDMTQDEKNLLQFHLGNLEYGCGSALQNVSAIYWNQNEEFPQYSGPHAWAEDGVEAICTHLADGLDIRFNSIVKSVDYTGPEVTVTTKSGGVFSADKVVCAFPLTAYQSNSIKFTPALPDAKRKAVLRMGAGLIEKIALKFARPFWKSKIGEADYFGHVPGNPQDRGMFSVFYDVSKGNDYILMTVVAGEALETKSKMSDKELIKLCVKTLKKIFHEESVPQPQSYVVSNWANEAHINMAYSYLKVGSSGKDCDILSAPIGDSVFFAGEATNRQFPQTVTGAYLSGLREAKNILLCKR